MDCSQSHLSTEFSRQECWGGLPFPSPEDLPNPGIKPQSPTSQADSLLSEPLALKKAQILINVVTFPWLKDSAKTNPRKYSDTPREELRLLRCSLLLLPFSFPHGSQAVTTVTWSVHPLRSPDSRVAQDSSPYLTIPPLTSFLPSFPALLPTN